MKTYRNKPSALFIIFLSVIFLPIIIYSLVQLFLFLNFDRQDYVISTLEKKYYSEFIVSSVKETESENKTIYYLTPTSRPDLTIKAVYWEGWNKGPMQAVPFNLDYQKGVNDDFWQQIVIETKNNCINEPIDLSVISIESASENIYNTIEKISELKNEYMKYPYNQIEVLDFSVSVIRNGKTEELSFNTGMKKSMVRNKLRFIE